MSEIKNIFFDENSYKAIKEDFQKHKKIWNNRMEEQLPSTAKDTIKKEDEKTIKKAEAELLKYASKYDNFVAWYLVYEHKLGEKLLYDIKEKNWYCYESQKKYIWELIDEEKALKIVSDYTFKSIPWDINAKVHNHMRRNKLILENLKTLLEFNFQENANFDLVVFKEETVINTKKADRPNVTSEIGPKNHLVQSCPIEWKPGAEYPEIYKFLKYITNNDTQLIKLILCIMHVASRTNRAFNLQFFLELRGTGGSGKSLLQRIFECLVPSTHRITSTLDALEKSQFESAYFKNKNISVFADHSGFVGEATMLKKITGGEIVPAEFKHKGKTYFIYYGIVIITTNHSIRYSTSETSIQRRRIAIIFNKEAPETETNEEVLYFNNSGIPAGPWAAELPGLIQAIYSLTDEEVRNTITKYLKEQLHNTMDADFINWIKTTFVPFDEGVIGVTTNKYGPPMYPVYEAECTLHGYSKLSTKNFCSFFETEFSRAFPKHKIQLCRHGSGFYFKGLMYIQVIPEELQNLIIKNYREAHGQKAYYDIDYNSKEATRIKTEIKQNNTKLHSLLQEINKSISWHKHIGLAITKDNPEVFTEKSSKYNFDYFLNNKANLYENYIVLVENDSEELLELLAIFLGQNYRPTQYERNDCKIATQELFDGFNTFLKERKKQTNLQLNQIKSKIITAWARVYPPQNYIQLKEANNITCGDDKKNLKGFMYIKKKENTFW